MKKFVLPYSCLLLSLLANNAGAADNYWDPTGTTVSATPSGNWEDNAWSTVAAGSATPGAFQEGIIAAFSAGTSGSGNFTVTVNSTHTIAGIFNGGISGTTASTGLIITGPGILTFTGTQGFSTLAAANNTTILCQLAGTGQLENEASGSLYLYGSNIYSGGTLLGTSAGLNFNNSHSFGTGTITWGVATTVLATPANDGHGNAGATGPITIANAVAAIAGTQIFAGLSTAPVTFSGAWTLPGAGTTVFQNQLATGGSGTPVVTISGKIGGAAGFTKAGIGTLALSGAANNYSGGTTISGGILSVTADNNLGAVPGTATLNLTLNGGTLNASNSFTLNSKRLITLTANSTISASSGNTLTYPGAITGSFGLAKTGTGTLALSGANGYTGTTTITAGTLEADSQGGSAVGTNTVLLQSSAILSGSGVVSGLVSGNGNIEPGTPSGPSTLTLGNGMDLSSGGTYIWRLTSDSTSNNFSSISIIGGNLKLGGTSKLSINSTAGAPSTNNPFWLTQEAWPVISVNGSAGNSGSTKFTTLLNGTYAAGNFTNIVYGNGNIVLLYQPNYAVFNTLYDAGQGFFGGENLNLTNFSGLAIYLWSSTNAYLAVSNWTLVGPMQEQSLAPALPGYSRYSINVTPTVSPTYYVVGNIKTGPYILSPVAATIITTPDFSNFTVVNTNVAISASGVLALLPTPPVILPGSGYSSSGFQMQFSAATNQNYTIQGSTNLTTWTNISSGTVSSSPVTFIDPTATNYNTQFYRVVLP